MQPGKSTLLLKDFPTLSSNVKKLTTLKELEDFDCGMFSVSSFDGYLFERSQSVLYNFLAEGMQVLVALAELLPVPNVLRRQRRSTERAKTSVEDIVTTFAVSSDQCVSFLSMHSSARSTANHFSYSLTARDRCQVYYRFQKGGSRETCATIPAGLCS